MPPKAPTPPAPKNTLREGFAKLLADPSRDKLHELLQASGGEFRDLDFKETWPTKAAVVKQVLGLANIGGGVLVVGVREEDNGSLVPVGLSSFTDKADITGWLKSILPTTLLNSVSVHDFDYPTGDYGVVAGKKFQLLFVQPDARHLPFLPLKEGEKILQGVVYVRREGLVDAATYEEVQRILNARIAEGHSTQPELDLQAHIDQLRVLYGSIEKTRRSGFGLFGTSRGLSELAMTLGGMTEPNPLYPRESFEAFVSNQVNAKKRLIMRVLGTADE